MCTIIIPPLMRDVTGGAERVTVPGRTVREAIVALEALHPGARARLCVGDDLDPALALAVATDGRISRLGLRQPVNEVTVIRFVPAIEGG